MDMVDLRKKEAPLWLESATAEERREIRQIDAKIKELARERQKLSQLRYGITNRCTVRTLARRVARKEAKANGKGS